MKGKKRTQAKAKAKRKGKSKAIGEAKPKANARAQEPAPGAEDDQATQDCHAVFVSVEVRTEHCYSCMVCSV